MTTRATLTALYLYLGQLIHTRQNDTEQQVNYRVMTITYLESVFDEKATSNWGPTRALETAVSEKISMREKYIRILKPQKNSMTKLDLNFSCQIYSRMK
jgi:hypothetical protein